MSWYYDQVLLSRYCTKVHVHHSDITTTTGCTRSGTRIAETYVSFNDIWDVGTIRLGSPEPSRLGSSLLCGLVQRTMGYTVTGTDSD